MRQAEFLFKVPLMSKARPRSVPGGGRPYMPPAYMKWKANLRGQMGEWWTLPPLERVTVLCMTFSGPARGDLDNLAGAVLDSGNQLLWADDRVTVINSLVLRFKKCKPAESSIYLRLLWEGE
jgi:Holliday junction resolvase RusA-like endonuclease